MKEDSPYLRRSHRTMLLFRRQPRGKGEKTRLELRHQRNGDVVFDWESDRGASPYIYTVIETLLPRAMPPASKCREKKPKTELTVIPEVDEGDEEAEEEQMD